jgi:hypothetical protein
MFKGGSAGVLDAGAKRLQDKEERLICPAV